ncbi:MAG: CinA family protein [Gammaproteobacteria bacterium]|nr:CinA family protein [Gammaproteobacteria bacterium]
MTSTRARRLHSSPWQGVLYVTGGGAELLSEILATEGASRTVLEASVPYSERSLTELLGGSPDQACSATTARAMAMTAFQRARTLGASQPFGFASTASLATDRAKRGSHRVHIAIQTADSTLQSRFELTGSRTAQEAELVEIAWRAINQGLGLEATLGSPLQTVTATAAWRELVLGNFVKTVTGEHDGKLLFPGSFNPLHDGHQNMMVVAETKLGLSGAFELSIENPDKPLLDYFEIRERLAQFRHPVWLTRLSTFTQKAQNFPNATFIVGVDTLIRIADAKYYGGVSERDKQVAQMIDQGTRFLVFGRTIDDAYRSIADFDLPQGLLQLCEEVTEQEFRLDISSTDLRPGRTFSPF